MHLNCHQGESFSNKKKIRDVSYGLVVLLVCLSALNTGGKSNDGLETCLR